MQSWIAVRYRTGPPEAKLLEALLTREALLTAFCIVAGYLIGTIPSGYLIARMRGVDIQKAGSGNIGATNVLRSVGVVPAILVMVMDPLKGVVATLLALWLLGTASWGIVLTGLATVLGNNFNVFLKLRGGKGIAVSLGVFLVINPVAGLLAAFLGIYTIFLGRIVSLGSLVGITAAPVILLANPASKPPQIWLTVALALIATWQHRENIMRLARGVERRLGEKDKAAPVTPEATETPETREPAGG
jgi:glycerol-3-phosphate acyltransferase PlsY